MRTLVAWAAAGTAHMMTARAANARPVVPRMVQSVRLVIGGPSWNLVGSSPRAAPPAASCPQEPLPLRPPWYGEALHERHRQVERESQDAGHEDRRPRLAGLEEARRALDVNSQRLRPAAEDIAHDRAYHGQRPAGPEPGEHERPAGR